MTPEQAMRRIDTLLSHVWMVRTFLKHSEEAEDDEQLSDVHRELYDYMLALGRDIEEGNATAYLKQARKKYVKLKQACDRFLEVQPAISTHTNFRMAAQSLTASVEEIGHILDDIAT